jgi:hypothetical protein
MEASWETFSMHGMYGVCPRGKNEKRAQKAQQKFNHQEQITPTLFQGQVEMILNLRYSVMPRTLLPWSNGRTSFLPD